MKENISQVNSTPLEIHLLNGEQYTCIMNGAPLCAWRALETMVSFKKQKRKTKYMSEGSGNSLLIISA